MFTLSNLDYLTVFIEFKGPDHQVSDIGLYKFLVKKNSYDTNKLFFWGGGIGY